MLWAAAGGAYGGQGLQAQMRPVYPDTPVQATRKRAVSRKAVIRPSSPPRLKHPSHTVLEGRTAFRRRKRLISRGLLRLRAAGQTFCGRKYPARISLCEAPQTG